MFCSAPAFGGSPSFGGSPGFGQAAAFGVGPAFGSSPVFGGNPTFGGSQQAGTPPGRYVCKDIGFVILETTIFNELPRNRDKKRTRSFCKAWKIFIIT